MNMYRAFGKVLIVGGYGVLQDKNYGLVLAVQNSFYSILYPQLKTTSNKVHIFVSSPQIKSSWEYKFDIYTQHLTSCLGQNLFVQNAIKYALLHISTIQKLGPNALRIILCFEEGFVSSKISEERFPFFQSESKTGLGSSACVTVCIVGALCKYYLSNSKQANKQLNHQQLQSNNQQLQSNNQHLISVVECISHVANLAAQRKIGSNFDIACAVRGTHLYQNALPTYAYKSLESGDISLLLQLVQPHKSVTFSPLVCNSKAFLLDVRKGENTRTIVHSFNKRLMQLASQVRQQFYRTSKGTVFDLYNILVSCVQENQLKQSLKLINDRQRQLQQKFGKLTDTQIEPEQLGKLIDRIRQCQNVVFAICPGAGGYDALFVMAINGSNITQMLRNIVKQEAEVKQIKIRWENNKTVFPSQLLHFYQQAKFKKPQ